MRHIQFHPEMIEAIRDGRKALTFRRSPRPLGDYVVAVGSRCDAVDIGLRIKIGRAWQVETERYVSEYFALEGFAAPQDFQAFLDSLYEQVPRSGSAHLFWAANSTEELRAQEFIPLRHNLKEQFDQLCRVPHLSIQPKVIKDKDVKRR